MRNLNLLYQWIYSGKCVLFGAVCKLIGRSFVDDRHAISMSGEM